METQRIRRFFNEDYYQQVGENERGEWYNSTGQLHRECDRPAVVDCNYKAWYRNGELHRDGSMPAVIDGNRREWWKNGKRDRNQYDDGINYNSNDLPAVEDGNRKEWWRQGLRHRDSVTLAPAIMDSDTNQYEYWREGQHLPDLEYIQYPDGRIGCKSVIRN